MSNVITPVKTDERTKLGLRPGDTVRVHQKIVEKGKTRIQMYEGLVISVKHGTEAGATFTVRATLSGIGVEKIFPLYAPFIEKIEIVRRSKVRRAKLYFIRDKVSREVRRQLRNMRMMNVSTDDFAEAEVEEELPVVDESNGETEEVTVTEVQEADPAQAPTGEELSPEAEVAGEPEGPVVDEAEPMPPAETPA